MSLTSVYVKLENIFYENLAFHGIFNAKHRWFICFDDDDPPELVMTIHLFKDKECSKILYDIVKTMGFTINKSQPKMIGAQRMFPFKFEKFNNSNGKEKIFAKKHKFMVSCSQFINASKKLSVKEAINNNQLVDFVMTYDAKYKTNPDTEGIYYFEQY